MRLCSIEKKILWFLVPQLKPVQRLDLTKQRKIHITKVTNIIHKLAKDEHKYLRRRLWRCHVVLVARSWFTFCFIFFFPLHSPILEPDFDLALRQAQCMGNLDPPPPGQITIKVELLFQFQRLVSRVRLTTTFSFCKKIRKRNIFIKSVYIFYWNIFMPR